MRVSEGFGRPGTRARGGLVPQPRAVGDAPSVGSLSRLRTFAYVDTDKAPVYRAVMCVFVAAKDQFRLHLRPSEVVAELPAFAVEVGEEACEAALKQLEEWGNLRTDADTSDVATVEDFYRERRLYQLSREGEAAERAIELYESAIHEPGELQAAALDDIREYLGQLDRLACDETVDEDKAFQTLEQLRWRFDELTQKAQVFLAGLQRSVDLQGTDEETFLAYKERLIAYLERFIHELVVAQGEIADAIVRVEASGIDRLLEAAARRAVRDRLEVTEDLAGVVDAWRARWNGLRCWFHGTASQRAQSDTLRARARSAIPVLLTAATTLHDRRVRKSDRHADLRTLARWFAEAPTDADAHRLFRAAFTLTPARHLRTNDESLTSADHSLVATHLSWLDQPTVRLAPRLRATGRHTRPGAPRRIRDRSAERAELALLVAEQNRQLDAARRQLITERTRLSRLPLLEEGAFGLFLELLGEALSRQVRPDDATEVLSTDGSLRIRLEPVGDGTLARVVTTKGTLTGPDCFVEITDAIDGPATRDSMDGEAAE